MNIDGWADSRFGCLKESFVENFRSGMEIGAAVSVVADGKLVAEFWGGHLDKNKTKLWQRGTLVNTWSATKGIMALAVAIQVERGKLSYDRPIAEWWPAFAAHGKDEISLGQVMSHCAGLSGLPEPITMEEFLAYEPYVRALERMSPLWQPGTKCSYHVFSYGHLTAEAVRRSDGRRASQFVHDEICAGLDAPFYIGFPCTPDESVAKIIAGPNVNDWIDETLSGPFPQSCRNPTPVALEANNPRWQRAEIPAANGHASATSLAKIYGHLVQPRPSLLSENGLKHATSLRFAGTDSSGNYPVRWAAGWNVDIARFGPKVSPGSFGHGGWGGTLAFADPQTRIGFAYVTNHMLGFSDHDPRPRRLIDCLYSAL